MNSQEIEAKYTSGFYVKRDVTIVHGKGALLYDDQGNEYIDCVGGHGVVNIGHSHPELIKAISQQANILINCPEIFYNDRRAELLNRLVNLVPSIKMQRAFLCNSGTEAVEAAFKIARISTKRKNIIAAMRCFHGRTLGALSATWNKKYREPFEPLLSWISHIPYNNLEKLDEAVDDHTAALILEVVQGEGGIYPATTEFLQGAQKICNERGCLLIIDEIQTGLGRTGKMLSLLHHNIKPDILCLAKSIAGGLPMGAVLLGENVAEIDPGVHASTFGGNPITCAASLAVLDVIEKENLCERASEMGKYALEEISKINSSLIREVRGLGLMIGIEIKQKVAPFLNELMKERVFALPAGITVIRLLPPLVISKEEIDTAISAIKKVLQRNQ